MVNDSLNIIQFHQYLPDTLRILESASTSSSYIKPEYLGLIGVIIGAVISYLGNLLLSNRQVKNEIKKTFFEKRLSLYSKIVEVSWEGRSVVVFKDEEGAFPRAYKKFENVKGWLNSMVEIMDKNIFLLDRKTYNSFLELNKLLLSHIKEFSPDEKEEIGDGKTRDFGRKHNDEIQKYVAEFVMAARNYMNNKYSLDLEDFI